MKYENIVKGEFVQRPNRFVAVVKKDGRQVYAHVKNTGRCKELLSEGATVYMQDFSQNMKNRSLAYSVIGVEKQTEKGKILINMDSQAPNKVVFEALKNRTLLLPGMCELDIIKPEAVCGSSRLDFYVKDKNGKEGYIEVKGVTLEKDGVAMFPDAPTERGVRHLKELTELIKKDVAPFVIFVIQMQKVKYFTPNTFTHKEFAKALKEAQENRVNVLAFSCVVGKDSLSLDKEVMVKI